MMAARFNRSGRPAPMSLKGFGLVVAVIGIWAASFAAPVANAEEARQSAWWQLTATAQPTVLKPHSPVTIQVTAADLGSAAVSAASQPVTVTDHLPAGVRATSAFAEAGSGNDGGGQLGEVPCTTSAQVVSCAWSDTVPLYEFAGVVVTIRAEVVGKPGEVAVNTASISGGQSYSCVQQAGGAFNGPFCGPGEASPGHYEGVTAEGEVAPLTTHASWHVAETGSPFGVSVFSMVPENAEGGVATQAGSHPFQLTTTLGFDEPDSWLEPALFPKNIAFNLPPGLIGNLNRVPQCSETQFGDAEGSLDDANLCPDSSAIGIADVTVFQNLDAGQDQYAYATQTVPVFNLVPGPGEPARFGFEALKAPVVIDTSVRTGRDYGIVASISNLTTFAFPSLSTVSLWGVPGAHVHDSLRGWSCVRSGLFHEEEAASIPACAPHEGPTPPLLRMPTSCAGPVETTIEADSWADPGTEVKASTGDFGQAPLQMTGCERLPFSPEVSVAMDSSSASSPAGVTVGMHQSQDANEDAADVASSDVRYMSVALPEGFTVNAASANGLEACSEGEIGFEPAASSAAEQAFSATLPSPGCPDGAKVGTVKIATPILAHDIEGSVYVARQSENPFGSLIALYIVAEDPVSGVLLKLPGEVRLDPVTGRVTATFEDLPQAPVESLEVHFFGGPLAALATPPRCGSYVSQVSVAPWSGTATSVQDATTPISSGSGGGVCPAGVLQFAPSFSAGTTGNQGGAYGPLTLAFSRGDGEQELKGLTVTLPQGLLAKLAGVPRCGEVEAAAGTCPETSRIGSVSVTAGVGSDPYKVTGRVFLTGAYNGGPFGEVVEVPAVAGPFNLGTVVVRGSIRINPVTAQASVVSDPFPTILQGIPLHVRSVSVTLDRPGFAFNPTDCSALSVTGALSSTEGASAGVSSPFQAVNCATLPFKPVFTASTAGKASKAGGASLIVKVTSKGGPGTSAEEANIKSVKVDLPVKLPSRLSTLQKACTAAQFESNPAGCPKESDVGSATAVTPVLASPLIGPAYLVSHGGEAFPDLEVVLQGEGVKLVLDGNTLIKKGVTSSTFKTVPDAPISSFELKLPTGKYSILGTNLPTGAHYSLCGQTLAMPTAITGQNGAVVKQTTKIAVSGCTKAKKVKKAKKKQKKAKKKQKKAKKKQKKGRKK